jgi:hypothetical protein
MARFLFLLLVVANVALAGHMYLSRNQATAALPAEVNRDLLKVVSITDSGKAQRDATEAKKLIATMTGAGCAQLGVKPTDAARAQSALASLSLADRLTSRNIEEFSRFAVALPVQRDRKAADTLVANLKKANVKDVLIMADNSVSLGLFSTEEAAKKVVADLEGRASALVKGIAISPKSPQVKETVFVLRAPDDAMLGKLVVLAKDFEGGQLKGVDCPTEIAPTVAAVGATTPATTASPPAPASQQATAKR